MTQLQKIRETARKEHENSMKKPDESERITGLYLMRRLAERITESEYWDIIARSCHPTNTDEEKQEAIKKLQAAQDECRRLKIKGYDKI